MLCNMNRQTIMFSKHQTIQQNIRFQVAESAIDNAQFILPQNKHPHSPNANLLLKSQWDTDFSMSNGIQHTKYSTNPNVFVRIVCRHKCFAKMCGTYQTFLRFGVKFIAGRINAFANGHRQVVCQTKILVGSMTFLLEFSVCLKQPTGRFLTVDGKYVIYAFRNFLYYLVTAICQYSYTVHFGNQKNSRFVAVNVDVASNANHKQ